MPTHPNGKLAATVRVWVPFGWQSDHAVYVYDEQEGGGGGGDGGGSEEPMPHWEQEQVGLAEPSAQMTVPPPPQLLVIPP